MSIAKKKARQYVFILLLPIVLFLSLIDFSTLDAAPGVYQPAGQAFCGSYPLGPTSGPCDTSTSGTHRGGMLGQNQCRIYSCVAF